MRREDVEPAQRWRERTGTSGIAEKGNGRLGLHEDKVLQTLQHRLRRFREVRDAPGESPVPAARHPAAVAVEKNRQAGAGGRFDASATRGRSSEKKCGALTRGDDGGDRAEIRLRRPGARLVRGSRGGLAGLAPRVVGRNDERGDLAGRTTGLAHGFDRGGADVLGLIECADPAGDRVRKRGHVGRERRIVAQVRGGVFAHDVHDRGTRLARVVEIRETVGEARAEVQQRGGRPAGHPGVTVGCARAHGLVQAEHAAHLRHAVEGGDKLHLARARIHEANVDAVGDQRAEK